MVIGLGAVLIWWGGRGWGQGAGAQGAIADQCEGNLMGSQEPRTCQWRAADRACGQRLGHTWPLWTTLGVGAQGLVNDASACIEESEQHMNSGSLYRCILIFVHKHCTALARHCAAAFSAHHTATYTN